MRVLVIRSGVDGKQTGVCMMAYSTDKEKNSCFEFMSKQQADDMVAGNLCTYFQQDIGFDLIYTNKQDDYEAFIEKNPEYKEYDQLSIVKGDGASTVNGYAFFKNWDCVEKAKNYKVFTPDVYKLLKEADYKRVPIEIENLGCEHNQEFLRKIAKNIASEIKDDMNILKCLRSGENRKKDNKISFRNWTDEEGKEMNSITYRNGGQAFSVLFDSDMNMLTSKYNNRVFEKGHEWIPYEDAVDKKDCLIMIYDKLPDMEFNLWLADMGENERYKQLKEEFAQNAPDIALSAYFPLKDLGSGYFTAQSGNIQMAIQVKDRLLDGYMFREVTSDNKPKSHWQAACPDPKSPLVSIMSQIKNTDHVLDSGKDPSESRFNTLKFLLENMKANYESLTKDNIKGVQNMGIDGSLDDIIGKVREVNSSLGLQAVVAIPVEMEERE